MGAITFITALKWVWVYMQSTHQNAATHTHTYTHTHTHTHAHAHTCIYVILVKEASLMTTHVNIIVIYVLCFMEWNVHFKQGASTVVNIDSDCNIYDGCSKQGTCPGSLGCVTWSFTNIFVTSKYLSIKWSLKSILGAISSSA